MAAAAPTHAPTPEPAPLPLPPPKPKSAATIGGASISDADGSAMVGEMKRTGWLDLAVAVTKDSAGAYESVRFDLKKGKSKGHFEILRPAKNAAAGPSMASPKDQKAERDKEGATYFDEPSEVLVIVVIDGNPKQAKKLIDALVKVPPSPKGAGPKKGP